MILRSCAALSIAAAAVASGEVITVYNFDDLIVGGRNLAYSAVPDLRLTIGQPGTFPSSSNDLWGPVSDSVNDQVLDDSLLDPFDAFGILPPSHVGRVFAAEDLENPDNPGAQASATWTFDVSGFAELTVSIDAAAMGNFDNLSCPLPPCLPDRYDFTVSLDNGPEVPLFTSAVLEATIQSYTLQSGVQVAINDPLTLNGVVLNNQFQTISAPVVGLGSTMTITLRGQGDGTEEVFLFDNIVIAGTPASPCDPDVNQDGNADQDDVAYLINVIGGGLNPTGIDPDFNRDGNADQDDVASLINVVAGGECP